VSDVSVERIETFCGRGEGAAEEKEDAAAVISAEKGELLLALKSDLSEV
jgi:hypothetical protein